MFYTSCDPWYMSVSVIRVSTPNTIRVCIQCLWGNTSQVWMYWSGRPRRSCCRDHGPQSLVVSGRTTVHSVTSAIIIHRSARSVSIDFVRTWTRCHTISAALSDPWTNGVRTGVVWIGEMSTMCDIALVWRHVRSRSVHTSVCVPTVVMLSELWSSSCTSLQQNQCMMEVTQVQYMSCMGMM